MSPDPVKEKRKDGSAVREGFSVDSFAAITFLRSAPVPESLESLETGPSRWGWGQEAGGQSSVGAGALPGVQL